MTKYSIVPRRTITLLIVHCTATPVGREVSSAEVDQWHRQRGWKGIGYHYLIQLDGTVERGAPKRRLVRIAKTTMRTRLAFAMWEA